jgi:hypothetical protein
MAIRAPSTLGAVVDSISHLFVTLGAGLTKFLASLTKGS